VTLVGIRAARAAFDAPDGRLRSALRRHHGGNTDAMFNAWADVWLDPDFARLDIRDQLPRVTAPVLAIQGDGDEYGTPRQLDLIAEGVAGPVETWLVPDCRHVPHHQAADRVLPRIAEFVRRRRPG
ncbi:MAG: alpha/beta hydrolase, partial [Alphaproteobacteria bacterium]